MPHWFNICLLHAFAGRHVIKQEATAAPALINHRPWRTIMPGPSEATDYTHCLIKTVPAEGNARVFLFIGLVSFAVVRLSLLNDLVRWWNDASIEFTGGEGAVNIPIISGVSPHWTARDSSLLSKPSKVSSRRRYNRLVSAISCGILLEKVTALCHIRACFWRPQPALSQV